MAFTQRGSVLAAADAAAYDLFGYGVALNSAGTIMAVGASGWEGGSGAARGGVYIFDWSGSAWVQRGAVIVPSDATDDDGFGRSCALSANGAILAVGASNRLGGAARGGVYIFDWSGSAWVQRGSVLLASDGENYDAFGTSIALSGDGAILAVGALSWDGAYSNQGGVYIYDWSGSAWGQRGSVLTASDAAAGDGFGSGLALSANGAILAVGAQNWEASTYTNYGCVYIFDWSGSAWGQRGSVLIASDPANNLYFGASVALDSSGAVLAVGATGKVRPSGQSGGVYLLAWSGSAWSETGTILAADDAYYDNFGVAVALDDTAVIAAIGAHTWEGTATDQGGVYVYDNLVISGTAEAPISITVTSDQVDAAPIRITVTAKTGVATAPISIGVSSSGSSAAAIRVAVVDMLDTINWTASVTLDGVDISARLTGAISIDIEEGASRTAEFAFFPESGELDPLDLLSVQVIINLIRIIATVQVPTRMFTGVVEIASFDPRTKLITLSCHDDLKNKVSALSIAQIDRLTYNPLDLDYSPGALGEAAADHWEYAQTRMECVSGALDAGVYGQLRATSFSGDENWGTFTAADIFDGSVEIELPQRSDIINKVVIDFEYRAHRCRERHAFIAWANTIVGGTDSLASGYQSPSIDAVKSAVEGVGWEPLSAAYNYGYKYVKASAPDGYDENNDWWYVGTDNACGSMVAELGQRHAQAFTEHYQITVTCAASAQTFGYREKALRGAVATDWDPGEWERDWTITTPSATTAEVDYAGTQTRTVADEAIKTLCMMAQRQILQSHRTCRVHFDIPCLPEIDLIHSAGIDTDAIAAGGKVARIRHLLDLDSGSAKTSLSLAIKGVGAVGGATNTVLQDPPSPPVWGPGQDDVESWPDDTWVMDLPMLSRYVGSVENHTWSETYNGYLVNAPERLSVVNFTLGITVSIENPYYTAGWEFPQTGFKITMPRVFENYRSVPEIKTITEQRTCIVTDSDPLTLTIGA